jgi:hypothetical protein
MMRSPRLARCGNNRQDLFAASRLSRFAAAARARGLAALLAVLSLAAACLANPALAAEEAGKLTRVQGQIHTRGKNAPRILHAGDAVYVGDTVVTGPDARAELTMADGGVIILSDETEFTVSRFDQSKGSARFELARGAFRSVTGAIARREPPDYEVRTPLAIIGVRGTDFWGGFFSATNFGVLMIAGKGVYVANPAGKREIVKPGQGITVRSLGESPTSPVVWPDEKVQRALRTIEFK